MKTRFWALVLSMAVALCILPVHSLAEQNISWSVEGDTLVISGYGEMDFDHIPWEELREDIQTLRIGQGVTTIAPGAFADCENLRSVTLPDSLLYIGREAFRDCESLSWVTLPEKLIGIEKKAFSGCENLTQIYIPEGVSWIEDRAFDVNVVITGLTNSAAQDYVAACGGSFRKSFLHNPVAASGTWGEITWSLENGVLQLSGTGAVSGQSKRDYPWDPYRADITAVRVEEGITELGKEAFSLCRKLTEIQLPESLESIQPEGWETLETVSGYPGTQAEAFAKARNCTFVPLEEAPAPDGEQKETEGETEPGTEPEGTETTEPAEIQTKETQEAPDAEQESQPAAAPELTLSEASAQPGQLVCLTVSLEENPGLCGLHFAIVYDKTQLSLEDYDCFNPAVSLSDWSVGIGEGERALWIQPDETQLCGEILTLVFRVLADVPQEALTVSLEDVCVVTEGEELLELDPVTGTIHVTAGVSGDANGDGRVTYADMQCLRRYLAGVDISVETGNADLNGDGAVNLLDLLLLQKQLTEPEK